MKSPAELMFDTVEFQTVPAPENNPEGLPYAVQQGFLTIMGCQLECLVLNTGQRIFTEDSLIKFLTGRECSESEEPNATQYGLQLRVKLDAALNATPKSEAVNVEK